MTPGTFHMCAGPRRTGANTRVKNALTYIRVSNIFPESDQWRFFFWNTLLYIDTDHVKKYFVAICSRPKFWSTKLSLTRAEITQKAVLRTGVGVKYQPILFTDLSQLLLIYISWKHVLCPLFWCIICVDCTDTSFIIMVCTFHISAEPRRTDANTR